MLIIIVYLGRFLTFSSEDVHKSSLSDTDLFS